jgi:hypothetical protein
MTGITVCHKIKAGHGLLRTQKRELHDKGFFNKKRASLLAFGRMLTGVRRKCRWGCQGRGMWLPVGVANEGAVRCLRV